jgi:Ca2+-binding RTX toxin-like protein
MNRIQDGRFGAGEPSINSNVTGSLSAVEGALALFLKDLPDFFLLRDSLGIATKTDQDVERREVLNYVAIM